MIKNRITHKYTLPPVYLILVVDDKIGLKKNIAWKNCFDACVKATVPEENHVEIDYSESVDDGFEKWLNRSYDIVLIDYDFTEKEDKKGEGTDGREFSLSTIFPHRAGAGLFRFLKQLIGKNSYYGYKSELQKIYIWTSHAWSKSGTGGTEDGVKKDFKEEEKGAIYKEKADWCITELIAEITEIDHTKRPLEFVLERLISLSLSKDNDYKLDGYVAFKKTNDEKPYYLYDPLVKQQLRFATAKKDEKEEGNGYLYLLADKPDDGQFDCYCSIDKLQITRKLNRRLNGNDLRKALCGTKQEDKDKTILLGGEVRLSALLDKDSRDIKEGKSEYNDFATHLNSPEEKKEEALKNKNGKTPSTKFAGVTLASDIWLAATPLTTVTRTGDENDVIQLLFNKLEAFFEIGIGAAVLKTTYLEANDIRWPKDHIQRHHRTRVFDPSKKHVITQRLIKESSEWTQKDISENIKGIPIRAEMDYKLWNTGKTALESFPPKMINKFLLFALGKDRSLKNKIIVSLGSKSTEKSDWDGLFDIVFKGVDNGAFPLVEVNVRHFMRPLLKEYFGGDEYLAPVDKNKVHCYSDLFIKLSEWIKYLHGLGINHKKKIILKFPFRSDIIPYLKIAEEMANIEEEDNYGISGVTLINTIKSPYPYAPKENHENDEIKTPQMSGEFLAWIRNYLLSKIKDVKFKLPVSVSGGVGIGEDDISYIRAEYGEIVKSIQVGTYLLKRIDANHINNLKGKTDKSFLKVGTKTDLHVRIMHLSKDKCATNALGRCGACYNSYYCDVFLNRGAKYEVPLMDLTACTGCGLCETNCPSSALKMKNANEFVILCCGFSESRAKILREQDIPFINMETPDSETIKRFIANCTWKDDINIDHDTELAKLKDEHKDGKAALEEAYWRVMYQFYRCQKPAAPKHKDEVIPLKDCVYLGVKTYLEGKYQVNGEEKHEVLNVLEDSNDINNSLEKYDSYKSTTAYVCIKKNKEIEGDIVETKELAINSNFKKDQIRSYSSHGIGKAGGIDILGYGEILFKDFSKYSQKNIYTFAGLPFEAIETIKNLMKP